MAFNFEDMPRQLAIKSSAFGQPFVIVDALTRKSLSLQQIVDGYNTLMNELLERTRSDVD